MHKKFFWLLYICTFTVTTILALEQERAFATSKELFFNDVSSDFIIRWGFQELCNHVYDPTTDPSGWPTNPGGTFLDPKSVKPGDIIFVRNIDQFMKEVHPSIESPYIIVTHGDQRETNHAPQRSYLDTAHNIIAWFSIHPLKDGHEKYYPLPLGIQQRRSFYNESLSMNESFKNLRLKAPKKNLLYLNFTGGTSQYAERDIVKKLFYDKPFCFHNKVSLLFHEYMEEMAHCKFALSPRGLGPDCYRTWEALLVGTIPIVRRCVYEHPHNIQLNTRCNHSELDDLYDNLPILVVQEWEEITEEFLETKYAEITARQYDISPLYMEYWKNKIHAVRDAYFAQNSHKNK